MSENNNFDFESIMDELSSHMEDVIEGIVADQVEDAVTCALQDALPEALSESLSDFEFVLTDGTLIRPRQHMRLLSPDKSMLLSCRGGLRVRGCGLVVQTSMDGWETIAVYQNREDAIAALAKVKAAMDSGAPSFEL